MASLSMLAHLLKEARRRRARNNGSALDLSRAPNRPVLCMRSRLCALPTATTTAHVYYCPACSTGKHGSRSSRRSWQYYYGNSAFQAFGLVAKEAGYPQRRQEFDKFNMSSLLVLCSLRCLLTQKSANPRYEMCINGIQWGKEGMQGRRKKKDEMQRSGSMRQRKVVLNARVIFCGGGDDCRENVSR